MKTAFKLLTILFAAALIFVTTGNQAAFAQVYTGPAPIAYPQQIQPVGLPNPFPPQPQPSYLSDYYRQYYAYLAAYQKYLADFYRSYQQPQPCGYQPSCGQGPFYGPQTQAGYYPQQGGYPYPARMY